MSDFPVPGGSCLVTWRFDDPNAAHGFVKEFDIATPQITAQLQAMYANGQRRLGIAVPYFRVGDSFALDSTGGRLQPQDRANLIALIQLAKSIGFGELLIEMIPEWSASYANWTDPTVMGSGNTRTFEPLYYDEDFAFTLDVDAAVASCGIQYRMNLIGEGADVKVCQRFWSDWCDQKGGHAGSVGFSMVPTQASIDQYSQIYTNGRVPDVLAVSAYNNPANMMDWPTFQAAASAAGITQGWIIQESLCCNAQADAIFAAGPWYYYRLVWCVSSNTPGAPWTSTVNQRF